MTQKILLSVSALCALLCALMLIWFEEHTKCGTTTCKVFETMFIIVALASTREVYRV